MLSFSKKLLKGFSNTINESFEKWIEPDEFNIIEPDRNISDKHDTDEENERNSYYFSQEPICSNAMDPGLTPKIFLHQDETNVWQIDDDNNSYSKNCVDKFESNSSSDEVRNEIKEQIKETKKVENLKTRDQDFNIDLLHNKSSTRLLYSNKSAVLSGDGGDVLETGEVESVKNDCLISKMDENNMTGKMIDASTVSLSDASVSKVNTRKTNFNRNESSNDGKGNFSERFQLSKYYVHAFWHLDILANIFRLQITWEFVNKKAFLYFRCFVDFVAKFCLQPMYSILGGFFEIFLFAIFLTSSYIYEVLGKYFKFLLQAFIFICWSGDLPDSVKVYIQKEISEALKQDKIQSEIHGKSNHLLIEHNSPKSSTPRQIRAKRLKCSFTGVMKRSQTKCNVPSIKMQRSAKLWEIFNKQKPDKFKTSNRNTDFGPDFCKKDPYDNTKNCILFSPINSSKIGYSMHSNGSLGAQVGSLIPSLSYSEIECPDDNEFESYFSDRNRASRKSGESILGNSFQRDEEFHFKNSNMHSDTNSMEDSYSKNGLKDFNNFESCTFDMNLAPTCNDTYNTDKNTTSRNSDKSCYQNAYHCSESFELYNSSSKDILNNTNLSFFGIPSQDGKFGDFENFDLQISPRENSNEFSSYLIGYLNNLGSTNQSNESNCERIISRNSTFSDVLNKMKDSAEVSKNTETLFFDTVAVSDASALKNEIKPEEASKIFHKEVHEDDKYLTPMKELLDHDQVLSEKQFFDKSFDDRINDNLVNSISVKSSQSNILKSLVEETNLDSSRIGDINMCVDLKDGTELQQSLNSVTYPCSDFLQSTESFDVDFSTETGNEKHSILSKSKSSLSTRIIRKRNKIKATLTPKVPLVYKNWKKLQTCMDYGSHVLKYGNPYKKHHTEG